MVVKSTAAKTVPSRPTASCIKITYLSFSKSATSSESRPQASSWSVWLTTCRQCLESDYIVSAVHSSLLQPPGKARLLVQVYYFDNKAGSGLLTTNGIHRIESNCFQQGGVIYSRTLVLMNSESSSSIPWLVQAEADVVDTITPSSAAAVSSALIITDAKRRRSPASFARKLRWSLLIL